MRERPLRRSWYLMLGDMRLGVLRSMSSNQLWRNTTFEPDPAFADIRTILDEEWALHQALIRAGEAGVDMDTKSIIDAVVRIGK